MRGRGSHAPSFPFFPSAHIQVRREMGKGAGAALGKLRYIYILYIYTFLGKLEWFVWNFIPIQTIFRMLLPRRKSIHFLRYQEMSIG